MVVKLIQSDDLEKLEQEINEFEEERYTEFRTSLPNINPHRREWSLNKFRYDIKVVPGYSYKEMYAGDSVRDVFKDPYFIAVIQY